MIRKLFALSVFLLLVGCIASDPRMDKLKQELSSKPINMNSANDIANLPAGKLFAMACQNRSSFFSWMPFVDTSLKGGSCKFMEVDSTKAQNLLNGKENGYTLRSLMYGIGPTFYDYTEANTYCKNGMSMAVKWLAGDQNNKYPVPSRQNAEMLLDENVIPVYVLYSDFKNANPAQAGLVAKELNDAGPAIIVSEAELDSSDPNHYAQVKLELANMKRECPNCLIALGLKMGPDNTIYDALDEMMKDPDTKKSIDLIAYGLNSKTSPDCNAQKMIWKATAFSQYSLNQYEKPSLIYYALFDQSKGAGDCSWSKEDAANAYSYLFAYAPAFQKNGIIGVAAYSLYGKGPLACDNCGLMGIPGSSQTDKCQDPIYNYAPIQDSFNNFFGFCQAYYTGGVSKRIGVLPLVFSTGTALTNDYDNFNIMNSIEAGSQDVKPVLPTDGIKKSDYLITAAACFSGLGKPPGNIVVSNPADDAICTDYSPLIEIAADQWDMDPALLRAVIWQESGRSNAQGKAFDRFAVSDVSTPNQGCNWDNFPSIPDPDNCAPVHTSPQGKKPCAIGLAQVIQFPSKFYEEKGLSYGASYEEPMWACGTTADGKLDFNPYRPYDSACAYAFQYTRTSEKYAAAAAVVKANSVLLGGTTGSDPNSVNRQRWYSTMFALYNMYGGIVDRNKNIVSVENVLKDFSSQQKIDDCTKVDIRQVPYGDRDNCCKNNDLFNYMKACVANGGAAYGYDVLSKYLGIISKCDNSQCGLAANADANTVKTLCNQGDMITACCDFAKNNGKYSAEYLCKGNPSTAPKLAVCRKNYCAVPSASAATST